MKKENQQTKFEKARDLWEEYLDGVGLLMTEEEDKRWKHGIDELSNLLPFETEEEKKEWIRSAIHYEERVYDDSFEFEHTTEQKIISLQTDSEKARWNRLKIIHNLVIPYLEKIGFTKKNEYYEFEGIKIVIEYENIKVIMGE